MHLKLSTQYLGQRVNFVIQPLDDGVVHARANKCSVAEKDGANELTIFGENNYCRNRFLDFQIGDNYGGTGTQTYSYKVMFHFCSSKINKLIF